MGKLSTLFIVFTFSFSAIAAEKITFKKLDRIYPVIKISPEREMDIQGILQRNYMRAKGPVKCPLSMDAKIDNLVTIGGKLDFLKKACLNKGDGLDNADLNIDEMLAGAGNLDAKGGASVGAMSSVMGGLGALSQRSCIRGDGTLDVFISIFTSLMGMSGFIPGTNGLAITGASAGLVSTLMMVKGLMERAYKFDDITQRANFINLTCSFFELRQELNASGLLNIPTAGFRADCGLNKDLINDYDDLIEKNKLQLVKIENELKRDLEKRYKSDIGIAIDLEESLIANYAYVKNSVMDKGELPPATQKLKVINGLTMAQPELVERLKKYIDANYPSMKIFDLDFLKDLEKLDYVVNYDSFKQLLEMTPEEFDTGYRSTLLFQFDRVLEDIKKLKKNVKVKWEKDVSKDLEGLHADVEKRNFDTKKYIKFLTERKKIHKRIDNSCEASLNLDAELFGKAQLIDIMANFNCIKSNVAAETAFSYMAFTTKAAKLKYSLFDRNFNWYKENLLELNESGEYVLRTNPENLNMFEKMNACQRGIDARSKWIEATGNVDQSVGYIKSIGDLLDLPDKTLYKDRDEADRNDTLMTKGEKLRRHQQSLFYAEQILKGNEVDKKKTKKIMSDDYIGPMVLKKHSSRKEMEAVQSTLNKLGCDNIGMDFGGEIKPDIRDIDVDLDSIEIGPNDSFNGEIGGSASADGREGRGISLDF